MAELNSLHWRNNDNDNKAALIFLTYDEVRVLKHLINFVDNHAPSADSQNMLEFFASVCQEIDNAT